ncbi:MAG: hypothetical protein K0R71_2340 [Bacillales bacterium]|jgi:ferrous iron transport protein A|nr:hypothetical protein [Bacillales bacterium]
MFCHKFCIENDSQLHYIEYDNNNQLDSGGSNMLATLEVGEKYKVKNLSQVDVLVKRRLQDLGVIEGSTITIKNKAPLGGPVMIEAKGQALAIRKNEANKIEVEKI